jgi:hypothetical protein
VWGWPISAVGWARSGKVRFERESQVRRGADPWGPNLDFENTVYTLLG